VSWPTLSKADGPLRVLGVDPGLRRLGYAVIEAAGDELLLLGAGLVLTPTGASQAERLAEIADGVESVVRDFEPHDAAMERVAFSHNVSSALPVAEAVGVVRLALWRHGVAVHDLAPNTVKNATTSGGRATKTEMQRTVARLLALAETPRPPDVADAIAIAYTWLARRRWMT